MQVKDLYAAADAANVIVPGGVSATVGAAGGFVLGGGHGPFAPLLGLAADSESNVRRAIALADTQRHPQMFSSLLWSPPTVPFYARRRSRTQHSSLPFAAAGTVPSRWLWRWSLPLLPRPTASSGSLERLTWLKVCPMDRLHGRE